MGVGTAVNAGGSMVGEACAPGRENTQQVGNPFPFGFMRTDSFLI